MARSPRRRIRLASVAGELTMCRSGWIKRIFASLTPATGAGTTRFCRPQLPSQGVPTGLMCCRPKFPARAFKRRSSARCHRSRRTALRSPHAPDAAASTATCPNVRDDGRRPSGGTGWRDFTFDLPDGLSEIFFADGLDSISLDLPVGQICRTHNVVATHSSAILVCKDQPRGWPSLLHARGKSRKRRTSALWSLIELRFRTHART